MKKAAALALIMIGLGLIGALFSFEWKDIRTLGTVPVLERKTVSAEGADSIFVETSGMNIEIVQGKSEDIEVRIDGKASKKHADRFELEAEAKDNAVYIHGSYRDRFFVGFNFVSVDLIVELPERLWKEAGISSNSGNIELERLNATTAMIETRSGNIDVEKLDADTAGLQSQSGNIEAEELKADSLTLETRSGNVKADGYSAGQVTAKALSGNITLEDGAGSVNGETRSGNIRIALDRLESDIRLKSDSGNVRIDVEEEPESAAVHFRTDSGNRSVEWRRFEAESDNEEELSGVIGSGQIKIDVETDSGNLKLGQN